MEEKQKTISPKKQAKMEKIEANLAKKREKERKVVILDNFGKRIVKTFVVIAFVAVLVPFAVVTLNKKEGIEDVSTESAITYVQEALSNNIKSLTYEKKGSVTTEKEEFVFSGNALISRTSYSGDIKVEMRKPTLADSKYIKEKYPSKADSDIPSYVANNDTDYLIVTYKLVDKEYVEQSYSLASSNLATFVAKGRVYAEIIAKLCDITDVSTATLTSATAKTKYNLFGLGYSYGDYKVYFGESYVTFSGNEVTEVYNFNNTTSYIVSVEM